MRFGNSLISTAPYVDWSGLRRFSLINGGVNCCCYGTGIEINSYGALKRILSSLGNTYYVDGTVTSCSGIYLSSLGNTYYVDGTVTSCSGIYLLPKLIGAGRSRGITLCPLQALMNSS